MHCFKPEGRFSLLYKGLKFQGFPRPDLRPSQFKNEQKLPKMLYCIPNFLVLHLGENFMKIGTKNENLNKNSKVMMHENLHKNVNENMFTQIFMSFYEGHLK